MHLLFLTVMLLEYLKFFTRRRVGDVTQPYSLHALPMHSAVKGIRSIFTSVEATGSTSSLPYSSVLLQFLSSSPW